MNVTLNRYIGAALIGAGISYIPTFSRACLEILGEKPFAPGSYSDRLMQAQWLLGASIAMTAVALAGFHLISSTHAELGQHRCHCKVSKNVPIPEPKPTVETTSE